jgi:hypothetical protein
VNAFRLSVLALMLALASINVVRQAEADEFKVSPDTVKFDFEKKGDAQNRTCNLMMMIVDPSRPEVVNFRIIHALSPTALFFGFSLDVGDMRYQNSSPVGLDRAALTRGDVSTASFSSEGSMFGGPAPDGGILKSTMDATTAENLWRGFVSGNFSLHLLRATPGAQARTYVVAKAPSPSSLSRYLACSSEIADIALQKPADNGRYERIRRGGPGVTEPLPTSRGTVIPPLADQSPLVGER